MRNEWSEKDKVGIQSANCTACALEVDNAMTAMKMTPLLIFNLIDAESFVHVGASGDPVPRILDHM